MMAGELGGETPLARLGDSEKMSLDSEKETTGIPWEA